VSAPSPANLGLSGSISKAVLRAKLEHPHFEIAQSEIEEAESYLAVIRDEALGSGIRWSDPEATNYEHGSGFCFEWWNDDRKLTIRYDSGEGRFLMSEGDPFTGPMDDGAIESIRQCLTVFRRLWA